MIWDTALRDVTGSGRGFEFEEYALEASGSTTQVNAQLSQTQFTGNQAELPHVWHSWPGRGG